MTTLREAAQQALEALEQCGLDDTHRSYEFEHAARAALRAALAQEEQEPTVLYKCTVVDDQHPNGVPFEQWGNAPRREWRGLTEQEREQATGWSVEHIETTLKDRNT